MKKRARRVLGPFTDRELKIIELRTSGVKPVEIARQMGVCRQTIYSMIWTIYRKAGLHNTALLTRWAVKNGLDEPLRADLPEEIPEPVIKKRGTKPRVKMLRGVRTLRMKRSRPRVPKVAGKPSVPIERWNYTVGLFLAALGAVK